MSRVRRAIGRRLEWVSRGTLIYLTLIPAGALCVRLLIEIDLHRSTILYLAMPYALALVLAFCTRSSPGSGLTAGYWNLTRTGLIIMLGSSLILYEGFLCVLMFLPLFFIFLLFGFVLDALMERGRRRGKRLQATAVPLIVLVLLSLEGSHERLAFARDEHVSVVRNTALPVERILANLARPDMGQGLPGGWVNLFPQPLEIDASGLQPGSVHRLRYRYYRWFVANAHDGELALRIDTVDATGVSATVVADDSYLSNYLALQSFRLSFAHGADNDLTTVRLAVRYRRLLDPAWYFGPLQRNAVSRTAEFVLHRVALRDPAGEPS